MEIPLKSGSSIIMADNLRGPRIIMMIRGLSIAAEIIEANEEVYGSDSWANKEIELYEQALDIDLQHEREFVKSCLFKHIAAPALKGEIEL